MISLEEAQARLLAMADLMPVETVALADAAGRWAVEAIVAKRTQPARDLSAMDGYAMRGGTGGPWTVIGESAAGAPFKDSLDAGQAVRIFTGAALPDGSNAVLIQEVVVRTENLLKSREIPIPGRHIRLRGSDFQQDDILVAAGEALTPARLALAAVGGHGSVAVRRPPRVAIMATGDELVPPGSDAGDDRLPESNSLMLGAMLGGLGEVRQIGIIPDRLEAIVAAIRAADADLLIVSGGASVGDYDLVGPALEACGADMAFLKVAMRPGKPVMAGRVGAMRVVGLPGNPVSAYVTALLFVMPLLRAMQGASDTLPRRQAAKLTEALPANGDRVDHMRAVRSDGGVRPTGINDSAALRALAGSDVLIVRAPNAPAAKAGDSVEFIATT